MPANCQFPLFPASQRPPGRRSLRACRRSASGSRRSSRLRAGAAPGRPGGGSERSGTRSLEEKAMNGLLIQEDTGRRRGSLYESTGPVLDFNAPSARNAPLNL